MNFPYIHIYIYNIHNLLTNHFPRGQVRPVMCTTPEPAKSMKPRAGIGLIIGNHAAPNICLVLIMDNHDVRFGRDRKLKKYPGWWF